MAGKRYITCPRCEGGGTIKIAITDVYRNKIFIRGDCPRCRGTGKASMMEKMGEKKGPRDRRDEESS